MVYDNQQSLVRLRWRWLIVATIYAVGLLLGYGFLLQQWQSGTFDGHDEEYVAVYRKEARGFGSDPNKLRQEVATNLGVAFQRIVLKYIRGEE